MLSGNNTALNACHIMFIYIYIHVYLIHATNKFVYRASLVVQC